VASERDVRRAAETAATASNLSMFISQCVNEPIVAAADPPPTGAKVDTVGAGALADRITTRPTHFRTLPVEGRRRDDVAAADKATTSCGAWLSATSSGRPHPDEAQASITHTTLLVGKAN
jgi:hypothetical protein